MVGLPILGDSPTLLPILPKMAKSPYFKGISLFFCWIFQIFSLIHRKLSNISPIEIVTTFEVHAALLKMSVENGHFTLSPLWNFQKVDRYAFLCSKATVPLLGYLQQ